MIDSKLINTVGDMRALADAMQLHEPGTDETSEAYEFMVHQMLWAINQNSMIAVCEQPHRRSSVHYYGYAACVPLRDEFLDNLLPELQRKQQSIRTCRMADYVLTEHEASKKAPSDGNALLISLTARENQACGFSTICNQLFLNLTDRMRELRARVILAEARRPDYKEICASTGCRVLYQTSSGAAVYYFDAGLLAEWQSLGTRLGDIMLHLWGAPNMRTLNLSKTRRLIGRLLIEGVTEKCLADELKSLYDVKMSAFTASDHVQEIRNRFCQTFSEKLGTKGLIRYLVENRFEIFEPKKLSELSLISTSARLTTAVPSSSPAEAQKSSL